MSKVITYHVAGWNETYENNRSRKVKDLAWVPIPNKHDGERYSRLMLRKNAAEIFSAWILILQVASRCHQRGSLLRNDGSAHDSESLSLKTRAPKAWFDAALPVLAEMQWLTTEVNEQLELAVERHDGAPSTSHQRQSCDEERIEGNGRKGMEGTFAPPPAPRARNLLLDTLATIDGSNVDEVTKSAWAGIGKALAEIKSVSADVTPEEIQRRAAIYRQKHPDWPLTPFAIAKHWGASANGGTRPPAPQLPPIAEPSDWKSYLNHTYPESVYSANMQSEAHEWKDLPRDVQIKLAGEIRRAG